MAGKKVGVKKTSGKPKGSMPPGKESKSFGPGMPKPPFKKGKKNPNAGGLY